MHRFNHSSYFGLGPPDLRWLSIRTTVQSFAKEIIDIRTYMYETFPVKGHEFVARARKYAKANHLEFSFNTRRGKGSHAVLKIGIRMTIVASGEIKKGTFHSMLKQLGICKGEF